MHSAALHWHQSCSRMSHSTVRTGKLWVQGPFPGGATLCLRPRLILAGNRQTGASSLGEMPRGPQNLASQNNCSEMHLKGRR